MRLRNAEDHKHQQKWSQERKPNEFLITFSHDQLWIKLSELQCISVLATSFHKLSVTNWTTRVHGSVITFSGILITFRLWFVARWLKIFSLYWLGTCVHFQASNMSVKGFDVSKAVVRNLWGWCCGWVDKVYRQLHLHHAARLWIYKSDPSPNEATLAELTQ